MEGYAGASRLNPAGVQRVSPRSGLSAGENLTRPA
jgi:hypothetical protein